MIIPAPIVTYVGSEVVWAYMQDAFWQGDPDAASDAIEILSNIIDEACGPWCEELAARAEVGDA